MRKIIVAIIFAFSMASFCLGSVISDVDKSDIELSTRFDGTSLLVFGALSPEDDKASLLEKEKIYSEERQKIEYALESFFRSAHSLTFQLNKRYIPKYLSILRCIDKRFETGEIYIKWDDTPEEEWLILIYIKNNSPDEGIIIEDKSNPEKNMTYEFQSNEIFKASDVMVDALTKLLDVERNKRKVN